MNFLPSLTEVPAKELEALQERAVESGFDFIDFWAIDFDWAPDQPFKHHWQDYRTRKDRSIKTVSDAEFTYNRPGIAHAEKELKDAATAEKHLKSWVVTLSVIVSK